MFQAGCQRREGNSHGQSERPQMVWGRCSKCPMFSNTMQKVDGDLVCVCYPCMSHSGKGVQCKARGCIKYVRLTKGLAIIQRGIISRGLTKHASEGCKIVSNSWCVWSWVGELCLRCWSTSNASLDSVLGCCSFFLVRPMFFCSFHDHNDGYPSHV